MSMRTPGSEPEDLPAKRMRLGTRSCAECRRRKVRCVFSPDSAVCEGCALHGTLCRAQQPRPKERKQQQQPLPRQPGAGDAADSNVGLQRRLEELEDMVRRIHGTAETRGGATSASSVSGSSMAGLQTSPVDALRQQLQQQPPPAHSGLFYSGCPTDGPTSVSEDVHTPSDDSAEEGTNSFEDAPLIHLFKDALLIRKDEGRPAKRSELPVDLPSRSRVQDAFGALESLLPSSSDLYAILNTTEKYWPIWPDCYYGPGPGDKLQPGQVSYAHAFITQSLRSARPAAVSKVLLWLALCIQQVPREWARRSLNMPAPRLELLDSYLRFARTLLAMEADAGESIDQVQCLLMQHKLYINMGKPQRAWTCTRQAVTCAMALGLHRLSASDADQQRRDLWSHVWQVERQMAVMLGFPSSIPAYFRVRLEEQPSRSPIERLLDRLMTIAGAVVDRDQNCRTANYATTVAIDQDMEQCRDLIPEDWWGPPPADLPFTALYYRQVTKLLYFLLLKLVHLPYMLRSVTERRYEHSRVTALEAARGIIDAYRGLRAHQREDMVQCELMDFQAFSAAVVLAIGLLSRPPGAGGGPREESGDWGLVEGLIVSLRQTAGYLECNVAAQGARVLEVLTEARRGVWDDSTEYKVAIPYFGKMTISRARAAGLDSSITRNALMGSAEAAAVSSSTSTAAIGGGGSVAGEIQSVAGLCGPCSSSTQGLTPLSTMVEFSANPFGHSLPLGFDFGAELGCDWSTAPHFGSESYDWSQVFGQDAFMS